MDALKYLIAQEKQEEQADKERFSFEFLAQQAIERQKVKKDTIIVIAGDRRNGKSNYGLKIIKAYIKLKRQQDPDFEWSWKANFPLTRMDAMDKVENLPQGSFIFYDEAGDVMYRADTLSLMNKKLIKFMAKSGIKELLTIIILPDINTLDIKILNMAHFLIMIPYRYQDITAFAFIFGRSPNPWIQDKFLLDSIKRRFQSKKIDRNLVSPSMRYEMAIQHDRKKIYIPYPRDLFVFMRNLPTFLHWHHFNRVDSKFEASYIKFVKSRQLAAKEKYDLVKASTYIELNQKYETLLYNLITRQGLKYSQLERFHMDPISGRRLTSGTTIKKKVEELIIKYGKGALEGL